MQIEKKHNFQRKIILKHILGGVEYYNSLKLIFKGYIK